MKAHTGVSRLPWLVAMIPLLGGCAMVGPDFETPESKVSPVWIEKGDPRVKEKPDEFRDWWKAFNDPVLDQLIQQAWQQNLPIRTAGLRVLEAQAQLGVASGEFYPQEQHIEGLVQKFHLPKSGLSERLPASQRSSQDALWIDRIGPVVSWELDLWGKFRRAIESADAEMLAAIAEYDNAVVTLLGDVTSTYINIRTLERRLDIARNNVQLQMSSLRIAEAKFRGGSSSLRDVEQARTVLGGTQASIPILESQLQRARNALSVLLGRPPGQLPASLDARERQGVIPTPPVQVAVGIPLDLLRRRPDIRQAEHLAQSQSAQIGVAKANLYPALSLSGSFAFVSSNASGHSLSDIFAWGNQFYRFGPAVQWNLFNYGQITNQVRGQDARYQARLIDYQNTVLQAQREVEDGLITFLKTQDAAEFLAQSTVAAKKSAELAMLQYREGIADFTTVLTAEQSLLSQQDKFASTLGDVASSLVTVYRGMGGGWQIREDQAFVPAPILEAMARRTDWGDLLTTVPVPKGRAEATIRPPQW